MCIVTPNLSPLYVHQASNSNSHRNYGQAKRLANLSLCCNLYVYIQFLTFLIIGIILLATGFVFKIGIRYA